MEEKTKTKIRCQNCGQINELDFDPSSTISTTTTTDELHCIRTGYKQLLSTKCNRCSEFIQLSKNGDDKDIKILYNYAKLVEAIIASSVADLRPQLTKIKEVIDGGHSLWLYEELSDIEKKRKINLEFANSPLISFFSEAFGIDETRIKKKIIENNKIWN